MDETVCLINDAALEALGDQMYEVETRFDDGMYAYSLVIRHPATQLCKSTVFSTDMGIDKEMVANATTKLAAQLDANVLKWITANSAKSKPAPSLTETNPEWGSF